MKACIIIVLTSNLLGSSRVRLSAPFIPRPPHTAHQAAKGAEQRVDLVHQGLSTTIATDTEALVIYRVVERRCPDNPVLGSPTISITPPRFSFSCAVAAGHSITGGIERFPDSAAAQAAFSKARGDRPLEAFHDNPAYSWQITRTPPLTERGHSYQAGRWVVLTTVVDDTALGSSLPSEDMYQAAARYCLFPGQRCTIYLAHIQNGSMVYSDKLANQRSRATRG